MSMAALKWFNTERMSAGPTRLCLMVLCDMANTEGVCWPSHAELAYRCNVDNERSIRRYLRNLERLGVTEILQDRHGRVRGYRIPAVADRTDCVSSPDSSCQLTGQFVSPDRTDCVSSPDSSCQLTGQILSPDRTDFVSPYSRTQEPIEPNESTASPPPDREVELPDRFPKSTDQAVAWSMGRYPEEWVIDEWHLAASRGGRDQRECLIRSWANYLAIRWKWEQGSDRKKAAGKNGELSENMKALRRKELDIQIENHPANGINGDTPLPAQKAEYERLKQERRELT